MDELRMALAIVGEVDGSGGQDGSVTLTGDLAAKLIDALDLSEMHTSYMRGKPVKISRQGGLEIWINGWYTEGRGVRQIVHRAFAAPPSDSGGMEGVK